MNALLCILVGITLLLIGVELNKREIGFGMVLWVLGMFLGLAGGIQIGNMEPGTLLQWFREHVELAKILWIAALIVYSVVTLFGLYLLIFRLWNGYHKAGWLICTFIPFLHLYTTKVLYNRVVYDEDCGDFF